MSNIKIDRGPSYTIPVDSMDLKYLSKYVGSTEILPLWTKTRLNGEAGYCQVQILAQNEEECYSEPTDTYECHICNAHIPVSCSKNHNESNQHLTFKNIYQKLLVKLSRQIDISIVRHDEKIDNDAYYCVPCSKIIKNENKDKHESSEFHAKSNKDTIIISEFYKIINEDKSPTDNIVLIEKRLGQDNDLEPANTKSCTENNNYGITINKLNNNYLDNGHDDLTTYVNKMATTGPSKNGNKIQPPNDATPGPSKNDNKMQPPINEKAETFKDYLEAMIKKYKLKVNLPVMTSKDIYLESSNGQTVIVSPEHFQSYKQLKNSIYCQLCKMWISQDTRPHDVTETHVRNIFKPINEVFARTIDSVSSHCVPCNHVVLTDSAQHTLDDNHRKIIKDTRVQIVGKTYCEDCNLYIDTHNFSVHIISKKHLNGIIIQHSIVSTENPNDFFCKLCNLTVSKNGIQNHVVARTHLIEKTNDTTKLNKNGATGNNDDASKINNKNTKTAKVNDKNTDSSAADVKTNNSEYCKICNVKVPIGGMETHVDGKAHKKKLDEYYKFLSYTDDTKTKVNCEICYVNIPKVDRNIIEHMEGRNHAIAVTGLLEYHHITKESSCYLCECCEVQTKDYLEHINSRSHTITFLQKYEIDKTEMRKYVYESDVNDVVARRHRVLYRNLLKHTGICKLNDTSYYCGMCQIKLGRISELDHVLGERHALKLEEIEDL